MRQLAGLLFDLRHPWRAFTREVALLHCQRTGQKLVPRAPSGVMYNITAHDMADVERELKRQRGLQ